MSRSCPHCHQELQPIKVCVICGKQFRAIPKKRKTCSLICGDVYRKRLCLEWRRRNPDYFKKPKKEAA